jgi:hypothetical protein
MPIWTASRPEIGIRFNICHKTYTTMDSIDGTVIIKPVADLHIERVDIELDGTSETYVTRLNAVAGADTASIASHTFLTLRQPDLDMCCPTDGIFKTGATYEFPFTFVVPERLVDGACDHLVLHPLVRDAHLLLPPTLGDRELLGKGGYLDDMSPEMTRVRYSISANFSGVLHTSIEPRHALLASKTSSLRIVPLLELAPPDEAGHQLGILAPEDRVSRSEKKINRGILRNLVGTLVMEALEPGILHLGTRRGAANATSLITVMLRFDPAHGVTKAPHLAKIVSKLEVHSFYSTRTYTDFPRECEENFDTTRGVYSRCIPLSSRTLSSIQWHAAGLQDRNPRDIPDGLTTVGDSWAPTPSLTHRSGTASYIAKLLVPIELPTNKTIVPTFHSCLVSRTYNLCISLVLPTFALNNSVQLRLPLQVSARFQAV